MKKTFLPLAIAFVLIFSSAKVKAQYEVITAGAKITKELWSAASWAYDHQEQIKMVFRGFRYNHRRWACIYRDGYVAYNDFRSYRNSLDAYNYFVLGYGDCDAFTFRGNETYQVCYENPMQARRLTNQHGPIVDIQYVDNSGNFRSIFND